MASITLKNLDIETHRQIKMIQFDLEDKGEKKTLEEIYLMIVQIGLEGYKSKNPTK